MKLIAIFDQSKPKSCLDCRMKYNDGECIFRIKADNLYEQYKKCPIIEGDTAGVDVVKIDRISDTIYMLRDNKSIKFTTSLEEVLKVLGEK